MKMFIHSSFGVLECESMTLQAIEKSIPEANTFLGNPTEAAAEAQESVVSETLDTEN